MYGGSAFSYANDPDFTDVSTSQRFWQKVIDSFYNKYTGLRDWHTSIVSTATKEGQLIMPTGRIYKFELTRNYKGELVAPETIIKNYPVQGLGADLMSIARVSFAKRFKENNIDGLMVNTVHDSIVCDIHEKEVERTAKLFHEVFSDIPINFKRLFGVEFDIPLTCEVSVGKNMKNLEELKF
ncbi:DNA polymerase [Caudoviricetes sp.]|nr:DNA polymerase [Caudoviricetes sp.]